VTWEGEIWQRLENGLRAAVPLLLTLLLALLSAVPLGVPGLGPVMPFLPAIAVFYWALYRPDLMPLTATFVVGLVHDGLSGAPFGLAALILVALQGVAGSQRKFFHAKGLGVTWLGFALVAAGASALGWVAASAYYFAVLDTTPVLVQFALTVAAYPFVAWPFGVLHRELLGGLAARAR